MIKFNKMLKTTFALLLVLLVTLPNLCESTAQEMTKKAPEVCGKENCKLPLCKCSDVERPIGVEFDDTPMMIGLSFNGVLTSSHLEIIKKILNPLFKNPNGCAVEGTFFVSNIGNGTTDYCLVQTLFNNNNEIAVGSTKYTCPYTDCESLGHLNHRWKEDSSDADIFEQKKNIATKAKINRSFLRGFRLPFLDQRGNLHFKALKKYAFNYDSSVLINPEDIQKNKGFRYWPHSLDFPPTYSCPTCPTKKSLCKGNANCSTNGMWVVPLHHLNPEGKNPCPSLIKDELSDNRLITKDCIPANRLTQKMIEDQLFENFNRHYKTNKAPFILNIELSWFEKHGSILTDALVKFINDLTNPKSTHHDVYFVTISKIIEWVQYPTPLNVIANKWLWDCDGTNYDYDEECDMIKKLRESSEELEEIRKKNKTSPYDLKNEDLFRNGILTAVIIIFFLSTLFTIFYDKYS